MKLKNSVDSQKTHTVESTLCIQCTVSPKEYVFMSCQCPRLPCHDIPVRGDPIPLAVCQVIRCMGFPIIILLFDFLDLSTSLFVLLLENDYLENIYDISVSNNIS